MGRTTSLERQGKNYHFVAAQPVDQLYVYNFEHLRSQIEKATEKPLGIDELFWRAIQNPGQLQRYYSQEFYTESFGYEYEYVALFDPDTYTMKYNRTPCPNRTYHHLGIKCPVCGSD